MIGWLARLFTIHISHYHYCPDKEVINRINEMEKRIMASLDEVLTAVQAQSTVEDSILALVDGLKTQLADALANSGITPEAQAKIDEIMADVSANTAKLSAAITATPAPE